MKSSVLFLLSLLLATAILAPSVITLTNVDEKGIVIEFNEEEKKEEKKEAKEKNLFLDSFHDSFSQRNGQKNAISNFHLENEYTASISIILPPPEHIS